MGRNEADIVKGVGNVTESEGVSETLCVSMVGVTCASISVIMGRL